MNDGSPNFCYYLPMITKKILLLSILSSLTCLIFCPPLFAKPADKVKEYTLENNMKIFLLEDSSDALVHIEFSCRAGFSSQTQTTNGFFKLYTRLVQASATNLKFSDVQCNADSSRYILEIAPQQIDKTLSALSEIAFSPAFSDEVFLAELTKLKNEVSDSADDLSTYINAAIDSRVFSDAPWKHDSGIYPPLFKKITTSTARNTIKEISDKWYTPQNSAIFISGNFNSEKILLSLRSTFGRFYSNFQPPIEKPSQPINKQRKYVFHNSEISSDLTQIVVQYTLLEMEESDLLAASLNNDASTFKQQLLALPELNIPGSEYINISSAHKKNSSRLIIQSLLQKPENKKLGITSLQQAQDFLDLVKEIPDFTENLEIQFGKKELISEFEETISNPLYLMNNLANFWALEPYFPTSEIDDSLYPDSNLTNQMMARSQKILNLEDQKIYEKLQAEEPFIFVIINSKDYKANKKAYAQAGFEEINENNSSWYLQNMYKEIKDQYKPGQEEFYTNRSKSNDNAYFQKNIDQIQTRQLENSIKIISKQNSNSTDISLLLSIKGGKLNSAQNNGFEEVMVNLLAGIIQKEINKKQYEGLIIGNVSVSAKTDISTSSILINFEKADQEAICQAIANSIIFGQVAPASADRAVSSKQYHKRLENGSATNQLFYAAVKTIYGKGDFARIFDTENDVLQATDYMSILSAYPALLDASRYSIILTGDFDDSIFPILEKSFAIFANNNEVLNTYDDKEAIPKNKKITTKIRHTFLTDVPAEEAGPQPTVLIPTTEFLDPVIYITKAPEAGSKQAAIFNAILNQIQISLQKAVNENKKFSNSIVSLQLPQSKMNFGSIYIQNVEHIIEADSVYRATIQTLLEKMKEPDANENIIQEIKNNWTLKQMNDTFTNSGTAFLMQKGLELFPEDGKADFYLQEYDYIQTAAPQDFLEVMANFPDKANLRVYSADGKN